MVRPLLWIGGALVFAAFGQWAWNSNPIRLKDRLAPRRFAVVEPGLYRSGQIDEHLVEDVLRRHGIDVIVDLQGTEADCEDQIAEKRVIADLGLRHERIPMPGSGLASVEAYGAAIALISEALASGQQVLVHCTAGGRRTGGVLAAFELFVRGDALRAEHELERYTGPGDESVRLRTFINDNRAALGAELLGRGVLQALPAQVPPLVDSG